MSALSLQETTYPIPERAIKQTGKLDRGRGEGKRKRVTSSGGELQSSRALTGRRGRKGRQSNETGEICLIASDGLPRQAAREVWGDEKGCCVARLLSTRQDTGNDAHFALHNRIKNLCSGSFLDLVLAHRLTAWRTKLVQSLIKHLGRGCIRDSPLRDVA